MKAPASRLVFAVVSVIFAIGLADSASAVDFTPEIEPNNLRIEATPVPLTEDPADSGLLAGFASGTIDPGVYNDWWSDPD